MENENKEPTPKGEEGEDNNSTQNTSENLRIDPDESRKQAIMREKNGDFSNAAAFYALSGDKEKVIEMIDKVEELKNKETGLNLEGLEERMKSERNAFIDIGKECKSKIEEGLKGRKLKKLRKDIDSLKALAKQHGANINPNDSKWIISGNTEKMEGAERRKKNYISELMSAGKINKEQAELIYRTECQKEVYKQAKKEYGKNKMEKRVEELVQGGEKIEVAKQKVRAELFDELIVKESETIRKAELEQLPPEEKRFYNKVFDWYLRQNTVTRLLISTGVITGAVALSGGFGTSSIAMFAGYRFLRGAASVFTGKLASAGVGWAMEKRVTKKRREREEEMKAMDFENMDEIEKRYNEHLQEKKREDRKTLIAKATAGIVAGAGTAIGAGMLENAYSGGGGGGGDVEKTPEAGKGGMVADHEEAEKGISSDKETVEARKQEMAAKEITLETKQDFYGKFVEKFGTHGEYGLSSNQIVQQLLEGKVSPEEYYDFVKENAGDSFNVVDKQSFIEKLERQIENYSNAGKMTGAEQDVAMRASLQVLQKTIDQNISYFNFADQVEAVEAVKGAVNLEIGSRGPQGSVIDYFKENPEVAKKFGWDGEGDLGDWAGRKAHLLWLENAKEALRSDDVLEKLEKLGYSKDINGYGEMMRHIGEGQVSLDIEKQAMMIGEETEYLKATPEPVPVPETEPAPTPEAEPATPEQEAPEPQPEVSEPTPEESSSTTEAGGEALGMKEYMFEKIGLTEKEFEAMKIVAVGHLMQEIPEDIVYKANLIEQGKIEGSITELMEGKKLPSPEGEVGEDYLKKQIKLSEMFHLFNPDKADKFLHIEEFANKRNDIWKHLTKTIKI
jgi:hypothetical protein